MYVKILHGLQNENNMKKKILVIFVLIITSLVIAADSPYARRIRPFATAFPGSCVENEIGYDMTGHALGICDNSGTYKIITTSGSTSFAPTNATYITQTANSTLTNEQALSALATGIVKNTTTTGVLSIAIAGTDYQAPATTFAGYGISDTSANFLASITNETGSGLVVGNNTPTFITPVLGVASGTSLTLSSLTSGRITFSTTSGLLTDDADFTTTGGDTLVATKFSGATVGVTTNSNASAGNVGEYINAELVAASRVSMTASVAKTITSISLTAGDWDVDGAVFFFPAATTTVNNYISNISLTNNTLDQTILSRWKKVTFGAGIVTGQDQFTVSTHSRVSLASTTTVYLIGYTVFGTSTMEAYGSIEARRIR